MKKRSAMAIAAGLVVALLSGAVALSVGFSDPAAVATGERATPRVRTIERTVTIHKKAKPESQPVVRTIAAPAASATATSAVSDDDGWDDDDGSFEDGDRDDDHDEDEDHEDEDDGGHEDD